MAAPATNNARGKPIVRPITGWRNGLADSTTRGTAPDERINTTPLVDVMLVLLIIFMITAPLLTHSVKDRPAAANSATAVETPDAITLSLDAASARKMFWNNESLPQTRWPCALPMLQRKHPAELHLRADKDTR